MFNKLKSFYKKNRVYSILMVVSIVCVLAILIGVFLYFIGQTNKDKYGNRLDGIESVFIEDNKLKEIESKISENELVKNVEIDITGKIIYVLITLNTGNNIDAEGIAQSSLDLFSEKEKSFYEIQYMVENLDKNVENWVPMSGSITAGNSVIKW